MPRQFHAKVRSRKFNWTRKSCAQMFQVRADNAIANADYTENNFDRFYFISFFMKKLSNLQLSPLIVNF